MSKLIAKTEIAGEVNENMICNFHGQNYSLDQRLGFEFLAECIKDRADIVVDIKAKPSLVYLSRVANAYQNVYAEYAEIGQDLAVSQDLSMLVNCIHDASSYIEDTECGNSLNPPFIFVSLPSYAGKTEATIALDNFSRWPFRPLDNEAGENPPEIENPISMVINLVLDRLYDEYQPIYRAINPVSSAWLKAVENDIEGLEITVDTTEDEVKAKIIGSAIAESKLPFHTVGLFCSLLESRQSGKDRCFHENKTIEYQSMTLQAGREFVRKYRLKGPIVVTLDEFNTFAHGDETRTSFAFRNAKLFFSRNIIRELECVAVLLGTDSRAVNLTQPIAIGHHSSRSEPKPSCHLITILPRASKRTLDLDENTLNRLQDPSLEAFGHWLLFKHDGENGHYSVCCSPGILKQFFSILCAKISTIQNPSVDLPSLLIDLYQKLASQKRFTNDTLCGTALMLLSKRRQESTGKFLPIDSDLVHRHFAELQVLIDDKPIEASLLKGKYTLERMLLPNNTPCLAIDGVPIDFTGYFKSYEQDELTYMTMISGLREATLSYTTATMVILEMHRLLRSKGQGNENVKTSDVRNGDFLENAGVCSAVLSTQDSGFQGVPFALFLRNYIRRLCKDPDAAKNLELSFISSPDLHTLSKAVIPYVAAAGEDARCTDRFRRIPDSFTGVFEMCANLGKIDGRILSDFLFELAKHFRSCECCKKGPLVKSLKALKLRNCVPLANIINSQGEAAQHNRVQCIFEYKNWKKGVDADALEGIIERFHDSVNTNAFRDLISHQVLILTTTKLCPISLSSEPMKNIRYKYPEVSIYSVSRNRRNYKALMVTKLVESVGPKKLVAIVVPFEDLGISDFRMIFRRAAR